MSYKENEVVAKFTKGNHHSDYGDFTTNDVLEMFDETLVTDNDFTVNEIISFDTLDCDIVVTREDLINDMFVHLRNEIVVPCSLELDYEFQQQSE